MSMLTQDSGNTYNCKACGGKFVIPEHETAVCCPICRMNRIELDEYRY